MRSGSPKANQQVQWTYESDEHRDLGRAAGRSRPEFCYFAGTSFSNSPVAGVVSVMEVPPLSDRT